MPQKQMEYPGYRIPSPAMLSIYDVTKEMYQQAAMVENIELLKTMTNIESREIRFGVSQTVGRRLTDETYALRFRFMENLNPDVLDLIMGDGTAPEHSAATSTEIKEILRLYGTFAKRLTKPHNILSTLPPPTGATGTAFGSGGSIAVGDWWVAVVAGYKPGEDNPHSTPAVIAAKVTIAVTEKIAVEWSAPAGITPDHYTLYLYNDSGETIVDGRNCGQTSALSMVIDDDDGDADYETPNTNLLTVKSYDEITTHVVTTDYTIDITKGTLKRVAGGGIDEGDKLVITYYIGEAPAETIDLGPGQHVPGYIRLRITSYSKDRDGKDAGLEVILYKVDPRSGSSSLPFTEDEYFAGSDQEWPCLVDLSEEKFGDIKTSEGALINFAGGDWEIIQP